MVVLKFCEMSSRGVIGFIFLFLFHFGVIYFGLKVSPGSSTVGVLEKSIYIL